MKKIGIAIFGRVWFFWFLITFFCIILLCYPFIILVPKKHTRKNVKYVSLIFRICSSFFCTLSGFIIQITGKEYYKKNKRYIIVSNHRSLMDIPMLFQAFFYIRIIGKKSFFTRIPFFSVYYKKGTVLVDRQSRVSRSQSFDEMKEVLSHNISMAIFPEGTRNRSTQSLLNFHNGAFKLAKETDLPILPVVLFNTDKAIPTTKPFFAIPTKIYIHILPPIYPNDFSSMEELRNEARQRIKVEYETYEEVLKN